MPSQVCAEFDREKGGNALNDAAKRAEQRIDTLLKSEGSETPVDVKTALNKIMDNNVGIFRDASKLKDALNTVKTLQEKYTRIKLNYTGKRVNLSLGWALELKGASTWQRRWWRALLPARRAVALTFARISQRNDTNWLKHTLAHLTPEGVKLDYKPVNIGPFEPKERKY